MVAQRLGQGSALGNDGVASDLVTTGFGALDVETREDRIRREASALWRALFDEPPPPDADGVTLD